MTSLEAFAYSEGACKAGKPRLNVQVAMLEIELMDGEEEKETLEGSKLNLSLQNI